MVMPGKSLLTAMNARTIGSGRETIVLAHGYGGEQSMWDKIIPHLATKYKVVTFDWIFSGAIKDQSLFDPLKYSSLEAFGDDLISLLEEMNLGSSSVLVGHSVSGIIGCIASSKKPNLFKRLILVGASPRYINSDDYEGGFSNSDVDELLSSLESNFHQWASSFAPRAVGKDDPISVEKFQNSLQKMRPEVALAVAKLIFYSDERSVLEKVKIPCTIIQTTKDVAVPLSVAVYMQKRIKGKSTIEIIDVDGHFPHLTAHLELLDIICRVLDHDL